MVPASEKFKIFKTGRKAGSSFNQRQVKEDGMMPGYLIMAVCLSAAVAFSGAGERRAGEQEMELAVCSESVCSEGGVRRGGEGGGAGKGVPISERGRIL